MASADSDSIELLQSLMEINSFSKNQEGLKRVREILIPEFNPLGFISRKFLVEKNMNS